MTLGSMNTNKKTNESNQRNSFTFISYDGSMLPGDPRVRGLIRSSAMKHAAAIRKKTGGYPKHNLGQLPMHTIVQSNVHSDYDSRTVEDASEVIRDKDEDVRASAATAYCHESLSLSPPPTDAFVIAMLKLPPLIKLTSPMTVLHVGMRKLLYFRVDCLCFGKALSKMPVYLESRRLLSFISSRYGRGEAITDATNCLISRLGYIVQKRGRGPSERDVTSLRHYSKALRSLQEALDDDKLRMSPETLCSVQILGIFELLNRDTSIDKWIEHVCGAGQLIELRGPESFQTDFELSLFMTHAGPIITEAFLNGKTCFVHEDRWQKVIEAAIRDDPLVSPHQEHLAIKLWSIFSKGPNLFKEVQDLVLSCRPAPCGSRENLITRMVKEQGCLENWLVLTGQHKSDTAHHTAQELAQGAATLLQDHKNENLGAEQSVIGRTLYGTYVLCCLIQMRLLYALSPSRFPELETACQTLARGVFPENVYPMYTEDERLMGGFFMSEVVWMAKAVMDTGGVWTQELEHPTSEHTTDGTGMIEAWKFKAWCRAVGRRVV